MITKLELHTHDNHPCSRIDHSIYTIQETRKCSPSFTSLDEYLQGSLPPVKNKYIKKKPYNKQKNRALNAIAW